MLGSLVDFRPHSRLHPEAAGGYGVSIARSFSGETSTATTLPHSPCMMSDGTLFIRPPSTSMLPAS